MLTVWWVWASYKAMDHPVVSSTLAGKFLWWYMGMILVRSLGTDEALNKYEAGLSKAFECKFRGRLGMEAHDMKEIRMLNRIIRITPQGLLYEADPRHAELLAKSMNLENCRHVATPGVKKGFTDEVMDLPITHEHEPINNVNEDVRMPKVQFNEAWLDIKFVMPYSEVYGCHPSKLVF